MLFTAPVAEASSLLSRITTCAQLLPATVGRTDAPPPVPRLLMTMRELDSSQKSTFGAAPPSTYTPISKPVTTQSRTMRREFAGKACTALSTLIAFQEEFCAASARVILRPVIVTEPLQFSAG